MIRKWLLRPLRWVLEGMRQGVRVFFLGDLHPRQPLSYEERFGADGLRTDRENLRSDWRRVGGDMQEAMRKFEKGKQGSQKDRR